MKDYLCDAIFIHKNAIKEVQQHILKDKELDTVSRFFKALSDPTRIKILFALEKRELCVCDIAVVLKMTQSAISHQLKILKDIDLVRSKRSGKSIFYTLADEHVHVIFNQAITHIKESIK
ncbi:ArsR/SmtB family transcription factor [Peloplasma aerotolerans]|uniref:Metalloregulator ArsR/SmtB family transcription factor n=1 Tax=Peloplasma aerotolerans TaxID=3044389 RepID=A0AAW6U6Y5_9MOLU|nr:metalloregulator ArsR/SmtB family transcription factor [Mariniplasma sp. M4Ah]MDI6452680.1 metalloregulator ArsR/SmtB family transcription factor [Mariniplasma sp. M4Ah]